MRIPEASYAARLAWRSSHVDTQNGRCAYCHRRMVAGGRQALRPTLDHVVPLGTGGEDRFDNTVAACLRCNSLKAGMTVAEFRQAFPEIVRLTADAHPGLGADA